MRNKNYNIVHFFMHKLSSDKNQKMSTIKTLPKKPITNPDGRRNTSHISNQPTG